jgi:hypothetical protein
MMTEQPSAQTRLDTIDNATLTPIVRQALDSDMAEIIDWERQSLSGRSGTTSQIYRFTGNAQEGDKTITWSLILKVGLEGLHGGDSQGGTRERLVYQSGFLNNLPGGLVAPRCYGVVEHENSVYWIWLEDIQETVKEWTLEDYGLAARHLGQFNGAYLTGKSLPTEPWISRGWLRDYVTANESAIAQLEQASDHPLVRRVYPPDVVKAFMRLWNEQETFYTALSKLPQTFCHMDAHQRNLFIRNDNDGNKQTVAADWAFCGIGAVGEELVPFIRGTIILEGANWDQEQRGSLQQSAFNSYLEGLQDAGWTGDQQAIQFCFSAVTAVRYGLGVVDTVVSALLDEDRHPIVEEVFGYPIEEIADQWAEDIDSDMLKQVEEARALLPRYQ